MFSDYIVYWYYTVTDLVGNYNIPRHSNYQSFQ